MNLATVSDSPLSISDLALIAGGAAAVFGIVGQLLRFGLDFLTLKFLPARTAESLQSAQCKWDHTNINSLIATQNVNISKMLDQNSLLITALSESNHASALRHEIVLAKLGRVEDRLASHH